MRNYYVLILCLVACKNKGCDCGIMADDLLKKNHGKVHIGYQEKNKILGISDNGPDKHNAKGGAYYFYPNGQLKSYKFFQSDSVYSYEEKYDQSGQLLKTTGNPLVDESIREVTKDSAFFNFSFFSLHKTYENIGASTSTNLKFHLVLKEDSFWSNIKIASFGMSTKGLDEFKIYFSGEYENECTATNGILTDTLSFVKNPRLNLVEAN